MPGAPPGGPSPGAPGGMMPAIGGPGPPSGLSGHKRLLNGIDGPGGGGRGGGGSMMPHGMMPAPGGGGGGMMPAPGGGGMGIMPPGQHAGMEDEHRAKRPREKDPMILAKNTGTSLIETFEIEQIRSHVEQLRIAAAAKPSVAGPPVDPNDACNICGQTKLTFEPPCLYCTQCGQRIKRGQTFHCTPPDQEVKAAWCHGCFSEHKGDRVPFEVSQVRGCCCSCGAGRLGAGAAAAAAGVGCLGVQGAAVGCWVAMGQRVCTALTPASPLLPGPSPNHGP